jgi:hypothetical protein
MSTLSQIPLGSVSGEYCMAAIVRFLPEELSERVPIDWTRYDDDGLGEAIGAAFKASNGQYFGFNHHFHTRTLGHHGTSIVTLQQSPDEAGTLDEALGLLELTTDDMIWIREDIRLVACDLIRQDDHGNQFCVGTYRCRADAAAEQRKLAASFHKQDYWIRVHEGAADAPRSDL